MKKTVVALIAFVLFSSHVMYLKLGSYFLEPNTSATIQLFNGTFAKSENVIDRDRMLDASIVANGERTKVSNSQWTEKDSITFLNFKTGEAGTAVAGISTAARSIEMDAEAFNRYLEHEGILDMTASREENDEMGEAAVEKYSKHVKTIFQVGDKRTDDWNTAFGYPIEFVPLQNPYDLHTGDSLSVKLLRNGKPLTNQLVYADYKGPTDDHSHENQEAQGHSHDTAAKGHDNHDAETADHSHDTAAKEGHSHDDKTTHSHGNQAEHSHGEATKEHSHDDAGGTEPHTHTSGQQLRTDANGVVTAALTADGIWYLQTIHLVKTEEEGFTHESNWTTLTFQVTHAHGADTHTHEDEAVGGIPSWAYWAGSLLLVVVLFFVFNRKKQ